MNVIMLFFVSIMISEFGVFSYESFEPESFQIMKNNGVTIEEQMIFVLSTLQRMAYENNRLQNELDTSRDDLNKNKQECSDLKHRLENIEKGHHQKRLIPDSSGMVVTSQSGVAFFVTMNAHPEHLGIHQIVEFPRTITNEGNAWDSRTSTFKAPRVGLYYFSASIMSHLGEDIETELVRNGVGLIYSYDGDKGTPGVGSLSGVLKLETGDDVWIRIFNNPYVNDGNVRVHGYGWSWFSGFIISQ